MITGLRKLIFFTKKQQNKFEWTNTGFSYYVYIYKDSLPLLDKQIDTSHASCKKHGSIPHKTTTEKRKQRTVCCPLFTLPKKLSNMPRYNDDAGRKYGERVQDHSGRGVRYHPGTLIHTHAHTIAHVYKEPNTHTHIAIYTGMWGERKRQKERRKCKLG